MSVVRIGAVSYLNTKPLIYGLRDQPNVKVVLDLPSRLADQLALGALDVALIPAAEYLRHPEYKILSDACIACRGEVMSVKLFSKVPAKRIQSLALDEGSRTSALMAQIILAERFNVNPLLLPLPIGHGLRDTDADATLLIGDRAIQTSAQGYEFVWDLGAKWCEWYSPSFVFAVWAARSETVSHSTGDLLGTCRDRGLSALQDIASAEAAFVGLTEQQCLRYLRDKLHFFLGDEEHAALKLFAARSEHLEQKTHNSR